MQALRQSWELATGALGHGNCAPCGTACDGAEPDGETERRLSAPPPCALGRHKPVWPSAGGTTRRAPCWIGSPRAPVRRAAAGRTRAGGRTATVPDRLAARQIAAEAHAPRSAPTRASSASARFIAKFRRRAAPLRELVPPPLGSSPSSGAAHRPRGAPTRGGFAPGMPALLPDQDKTSRRLIY